MDTIQPTLKRGRNLWDPINMPESEFKGRIENILKAMKKAGIDVLFLYGKDNKEYGDPCYISNFVRRMPQEVLGAITSKGEVALIFEGSSRDLPAAKATTWVKEVRGCGDVPKDCIKFLTERNLIPSTIGFDGLEQMMPYNELQVLHQGLQQCKIVDASDLVRNIRMVKSQNEINQVRRVSRILNKAFNAISDTPLKGMNEKLIEAIIDREARMDGAEDVRVLVAKPQEQEWAFRPAEEVPISAGETIIVYLAVEFERYWAEGIKTFITDNNRLILPEQGEAKVLYSRILEGLKPGKSSSKFYLETMGEIKKSKFEYIADYGLGQGIGLDLQEFPLLAEKNRKPLKEGMCLTLRLAIKDRKLGAIMLGNTLLLSKSGVEVLSS